MSETKIEREADSLDLELFRMSSRLEQLAVAARDPLVDDASRIVFGLRMRVQKHMSQYARAALASPQEPLP